MYILYTRAEDAIARGPCNQGVFCTMSAKSVRLNHHVFDVFVLPIIKKKTKWSAFPFRFPLYSLYHLTIVVFKFFFTLPQNISTVLHAYILEKYDQRVAQMKMRQELLSQPELWKINKKYY